MNCCRSTDVAGLSKVLSSTCGRCVEYSPQRSPRLRVIVPRVTLILVLLSSPLYESVHASKLCDTRAFLGWSIDLVLYSQSRHVLRSVPGKRIPTQNSGITPANVSSPQELLTQVVSVSACQDPAAPLRPPEGDNSSRHVMSVPTPRSP